MQRAGLHLVHRGRCRQTLRGRRLLRFERRRLFLLRRRFDLKNDKGALVVFSDVQDSTTCHAWALNRFEHLEAVSFDCGQRHRVELECRGRACHVVERGRDEAGILRAQAATPAASRHAANASARKRRCVRAVVR
ncbi:hypothetical protein FFK22_041730 [Mycobacterium sp. KBS0706]|uniref:7-cyano-7-deazaguanine synthase n=1 Tax=Mycobacterium sp. KBS0706 TaxID=2578109 RepID=UPI00110F70C4|nr:hypothetical protein FFK22_041730 [Mycobacterium sp. KBS0706]